VYSDIFFRRENWASVGRGAGAGSRSILISLLRPACSLRWVHGICACFRQDIITGVYSVHVALDHHANPRGMLHTSDRDAFSPNSTSVHSNCISDVSMLYKHTAVIPTSVPGPYSTRMRMWLTLGENLEWSRMHARMDGGGHVCYTAPTRG